MILDVGARQFIMFFTDGLVHFYLSYLVLEYGYKQFRKNKKTFLALFHMIGSSVLAYAGIEFIVYSLI